MNISDMETQNPPEVDLIADQYSHDSACEAEIDSSLIQVCWFMIFIIVDFIWDGRRRRYRRWKSQL